MSTLGSLGQIAGQAAASGGGGGIPGVGGSIPSITGGMAGPATSGGEQTGFNDRNLTNIAPIGVNIGEILRNFEGDKANGGFGLEPRSRFLFGDRPLQASFGLAGAGSNVILPLLLLAGGAAVFFLVRRRG